MTRAGMMTLSVILCFLGAPAAWALDCPTPSTQKERDISVDATVKLGKLGPLSAGEADTKIKSTTQNLFAAYPNADKITIANSILSAGCQLLDKAKMTDEQKLDSLLKLSEAVSKIMK